MSSPISTLRLLADLKAIQKDPPTGCSASPLTADDLSVWNATIFGPEDTPWEGGVFSLRLSFGEDYPVRPPRVRFTCDMFHPNVYDDGGLCLDVIQERWSPCQNICSVLLSIQSLLMDPNCSSPANPDAARMYETDRRSYNRKIRRIAQDSVN